MDEATTVRRGEPLRTVVLRKGAIVDGKYRLLRQLGRGGMGQVFAARDEKLAREVAIKVLRADLLSHPSVVKRFLHEARLTGSLRSENAIRIFDVGRLDSGIPYIVMELLEGEDLASYVDINGAVDVLDAIDFVLMACEAVDEAHGLGIIHRDLKPANFFLTRDRFGNRIVKVLDFGLAKSDRGSFTNASDVLGSPQFMAPEQIRKPSAVDVRADIWSLGATLHHLVTGRTPYESGSVLEVLARVMTGPPRPIREIRAHLPKELEDVISLCLRVNREERFESVKQLARALRDARAAIEDPAPPTVASWQTETEVLRPRPLPTIEPESEPEPMSASPATVRFIATASARPRAPVGALPFVPRTPVRPFVRPRMALMMPPPSYPDLEPVPSRTIPSQTRASLAAGAVGMVAVAFAVAAFVQAIAR